MTSRIAILIICILLGASSAFPQHSSRALSSTLCSEVRSCANAGQSCGSTQTDAIVYTGCNGNNVCNITRSTDTTTYGLCIPLPGANQPCAGTEQCAPGYTCDPVSQKCSLESIPTNSPGTLCTADSQCRYIRDDGTVVSKCNAGRCQYNTDLSACTLSFVQCNSLTSFCNMTDHLCHVRLATGACDLTAAESGCFGDCVPTSVNSNIGKCATTHSVQASQPCVYDENCAEGLICAPAASGAQYGVCKQVAQTATILKSCTSSADCTQSNNEYCSCNTKYSATPICTVDVIPPGYTAANNAYQTCAGSNCALGNGDYNTSCLVTKCLQQYCTYAQLSATVSDSFASDCFYKNTLLPLCSTSVPTSAPSTGDDFIRKTSSASTTYSSILAASLCGLVVIYLTL